MFTGDTGAAAPAEAREWVPLATIQRITGATPTAVKSMALAGSIRYRSVPGARTLYSRADAERISQQPAVAC